MKVRAQSTRLPSLPTIIQSSEVLKTALSFNNSLEGLKAITVTVRVSYKLKNANYNQPGEEAHRAESGRLLHPLHF